MKSIKVINSSEINKETISNYIPRSFTQITSVKDIVESIINSVRNDGDDAIIRFTKQYDNVELSKNDTRVSKTEISEAYSRIDPLLLEAIKSAKQNLIKFNEVQKRKDWMREIEKGVIAGQIYRPLETIGIYIPGGQAIYPSTVLMIAAPAYVAGIKEIILCSPPQSDGKVASEIIVAASEFNITNIYKIGGAQAIAAMAYGTESVPVVQKIFGPGSIWVNAAKQLVSTVVPIDSPAGPSEILIIADRTATPKYVILDLLSQIEHDPDNVGIIITDSDYLISQINNIIDYYVSTSKRKDIITESLTNNTLIIRANNIAECVRISNLIAPEHLEILTENPSDIVSHITNAGAIFLGENSPVSLGDYSAGTNHVLPTGGAAKNYSGLNLFDFLKTIDVLKCEKEGLENLSKTAIKFAEFEGLFSHKRSIEERLKDKD
ncbi:MAG: histidinol dehydrogenase [Promethearchaeota archaeon]|jgi:histidinol dehydrogenase